MEEYDNLVASVEKLEITDEQKQAILSNAKTMNTTLGVRGSDLINIKKQLEDSASKNNNYKEFARSLAKHGVTESEITKLAERAGIEKTQQDTIDELTSIVKETQGREVSVLDRLRIFEQEKTLAPQFDQAVKDFKDKDGKEIVIRPSFLEGVKVELFKGIKEGDNEAIVTDRINKALLQAHSDQETFMEKNGLRTSESSTHRVDEGSVAGSASPMDSKGIKPEEIQKQLRDGGGSTESAAAIIAKLREAYNTK